MGIIKAIFGLIGGLIGLVLGIVGAVLGTVLGILGAVFGLGCTAVVLVALFVLAPIGIILAIIF
ncbi:MAG TPA: hypothetical protein G4N95_08610 [Anaerolineae bacterium]|nr:hypothetical protein [Anaerolineae bacterium]